MLEFRSEICTFISNFVEGAYVALVVCWIEKAPEAVDAALKVMKDNGVRALSFHVFAASSKTYNLAVKAQVAVGFRVE